LVVNGPWLPEGPGPKQACRRNRFFLLHRLYP
jgi:hypothetical protein